MRRAALRVALSLYPRAWRHRYGDELTALLDELEASRTMPFVFMLLDLVFAGVTEQVRRPTRNLGTLAVLLSAVGCGAMASVVVRGDAGPSRAPAPQQLAFASGTCDATISDTTLNVVVARVRGAGPMFHTKKTIVCTLAALGAGLPAAAIAAGPSNPQPPSITSSLAAQVAAHPGIASYLESSTPKTVEESGTTVVWVGTGNASWNGAGWSYPTDGATVAGAYQPIPGISSTPGS